MSTLKSSSTDLTLNADGVGNDIIFQSNAGQVGSLTAEGVLTATSYAGSGAALTNIVAASGVATDATKLPLAGGALTGAVTTNSTFDGVDIATRDAILTSTTTTAGAALPKAGGTMTGAITTLSISETETTKTGSFTPKLTTEGTIFDVSGSQPEFVLSETIHQRYSVPTTFVEGV